MNTLSSILLLLVLIFVIVVKMENGGRDYTMLEKYFFKRSQVFYIDFINLDINLDTVGYTCLFQLY